MGYKYRIPSNFRKVLKKKPSKMQEKIFECIAMLSESPRNPKLNTHKMKGRKGVWEAYVDNDGNRLTFEYEGDLIVLRNNCNHDMLYRNP